MSAAAAQSWQQPRLPAEILVDIIELAILTSSPCALVPPSVSKGVQGGSPFSHPLRAAYSSAWAWTGHLLRVSKLFYSIARPLLLQTLTLDTDAAARTFFTTLSEDKDPHQRLGCLDRAWLGNLSALERKGIDIKPIGWRLREAAWYEECPGGFVVGHAYASRPKPASAKKKERRQGGTRQKQYRSVSVYWAEEQLIEEVSDPDRSTDEDSDADASDRDATHDLDRGLDDAQPVQHSSSSTSALPIDAPDGGGSNGQHVSQVAPGSVGDPRLDRPHEPAWQTLYSRQRRLSPVHARSPMGASATSNQSARIPQPSMSATAAGPNEDDLDPWDMQDAQERLAALAAQPSPPRTAAEAQYHPSKDTPEDSDRDGHVVSTLAVCQARMRRQRRGREIYAYHVCTATLEAWIAPLLASVRTLRLITLSFYPGHIVDDDKLEHMLRRILAENARLETLLIRIVLDAASAGSRMRRFERTKTIAGAVDRIGDERVRVMLANTRVGEGELVALPHPRLGDPGGALDPLSRRAVMLIKEAWWARVLQQNHARPETQDSRSDNTEAVPVEREREASEERLSNWQMFFPPHQHGNPSHLVNLIHHADSWPDHPNPLP